VPLVVVVGVVVFWFWLVVFWLWLSVVLVPVWPVPLPELLPVCALRLNASNRTGDAIHSFFILDPSTIEFSIAMVSILEMARHQMVPHVNRRQHTKKHALTPEAHQDACLQP
jgi:hypothetical protein